MIQNLSNWPFFNCCDISVWLPLKRLLAHITVIDGLSDRQREGEGGCVYSPSPGMFHVAGQGAVQKIHAYLCRCV